MKNDVGAGFAVSGIPTVLGLGVVSWVSSDVAGVVVVGDVKLGKKL